MKFLFWIHTQDCNVKYIFYWQKKKRKNYVCLGLLKQFPRFKAGLLGSVSQEFCTLNEFPWGYQYTVNFGVSSLGTSVGSGVSGSLIAMKELIKLLPPCSDGYPLFGRGSGDDGTRAGAQDLPIQCSHPCLPINDPATGHFSPTPSTHSPRGPIRPVPVRGGHIVSIFQSRQIKRIQLPDVSLA